MLKLITAIFTVLLGVGFALALYWLLNKLTELMPSTVEHRVKPYFYILPAYLAIIVYLLYPAIQTVIDSFKDPTSTSWVGFSNFNTLLTNHNFQQTLVNTLLWMAVVPISTVVIGLVVAVLADRLGPRGEKFSKTIIFLPMAISMVGAATVWKFVYAYKPPGEQQIGIQNAVWVALGGSPQTWLEKNHLHVNSLLLMVMLLWAQVGFAMILLSSAVKGVPVETYEAARIDGANERQIFFRVVIPQIRGTLITVFVTVLITVMKVFDIVYVMTNGNFNTNVVGLEFFNQLFTNFNNGQAAAIVVLLMVATVPIMIYQVRVFKQQEAEA